MEITANALDSAKIAEIGTQLAAEDCNALYMASEMTETLESTDRAAVYEVARGLVENRLKEAVASGDLSLVCPALAKLAEITHLQGDYKLTRALLKDLLHWKKRYAVHEYYYLSLSASILENQGDLAAARQCREDAVVKARHHKIDLMTSMKLCSLGILAGKQRELDYARRCFAESIAFDQVWQKERADKSPESVEGNLFMIYQECIAVLLEHRQTAIAIPLLAAGQAIGQRIEAPPGSYHQNERFQDAIKQAQKWSDPDQFARTWEAGLTMTPEQIQTHLTST